MTVILLTSHVDMWPYVTTTKNIVKLLADVEVFLVSFTGLLLLIGSDKLTVECESDIWRQNNFTQAYCAGGKELGSNAPGTWAYPHPF